MSICFANSIEEPFEAPHDKPTIWLCAQRRLRSARLNLFGTFNVIAIKLVVILNHFPGDKTVFYGLYLTLVFVVTVQSGNIAHIRILMVMHDSFKSITR